MAIFRIYNDLSLKKSFAFRFAKNDISLQDMAKGFVETDSQCRQIVKDVRSGVFAPVYLLMGEEPYYVDMVCDAVLEHCLDESERDFNQTVCYGADVNADSVITAARRYPMFAERQLVVVKEAQMMKSLEDLALYCQKPLDSTVLVIAMHGASADSSTAIPSTSPSKPSQMSPPPRSLP